jgi:hypothetical protein
MTRRWRPRIGAAAALVLIFSAMVTVGQGRAYADASAPPSFPTNCPGPSGPPPGYPNPPPPASSPITYTAPTGQEFDAGTHQYSGSVPYQVPFKGIIYGNKPKKSQVTLPPYVVIPHLFASVCGTVTLPQLTGSIAASNINLATLNIYIAGLEALPATVTFGDLSANVLTTPAQNGGLDITLSGQATPSVSTLGMTCAIVLNANFSTLAAIPGGPSGQPVTGPTESGQAEVVSHSFAVPAVQTSTSCPPSIAQTFNKLLGLPAPAGVGTFTAPFCFDFELQGTNNPSSLVNSKGQPLNPECPWPKS